MGDLEELRILFFVYCIMSTSPIKSPLSAPPDGSITQKEVSDSAKTKKEAKQIEAMQVQLDRIEKNQQRMETKQETTDQRAVAAAAALRGDVSTKARPGGKFGLGWLAARSPKSLLGKRKHLLSPPKATNPKAATVAKITQPTAHKKKEVPKLAGEKGGGRRRRTKRRGRKKRRRRRTKRRKRRRRRRTRRRRRK